MPGGVFKAGGVHANGWISYETGTFHFDAAAGDLFVQVEHAGLDWPVAAAYDAEPVEYYAENFGAYQRYFKIAEDADGFVTVAEYLNSYRDAAGGLEGLYDPAPVWEAVAGSYRRVKPLPPERLLTLK